MDTSQLLRELAADPDLLRRLTPREFEQIVAELLASFGWKVSLTPATRDGGRDIIAVSQPLPGVESTWLVECKRYGPDRPVGVEVARSIVGAGEFFQVPNTLIVTTSRFTKDAAALAQSRPSLALADFERLSEWLRGYHPPASAPAHLPARSFQSCFISHSTRDGAFVSTLVEALRSRGIRVWFAPDDLLPGDHLQSQLKRALSAFSRVLVVLSESSLCSPWVQAELYDAFRREQSEGRRVLFPVSLLPFDRLAEWSLVDPDTGVDIAREIRRYFILDFSNWQDSAAFNSALERLSKALEHPSDAA